MAAKRKQTSQPSKPVTAARPTQRARNFDAGKNGRRLGAIPSTSQAINSQVSRYGRTIVARSRYLASNNPYASLAKESFVSALVGCGIKPSPLSVVAVGRGREQIPVKQLINTAWRKWTDEADADNLTDFYGLQTMIAGEIFEAGEVFVRLRSRTLQDGLSVPLQLQLLQSEMLDVSHNELLGNGNRVQCGVEFDRIGRRVGYWFYRSLPGEFASAGTTAAGTKVRVPATEVLHLFRPIRPGQVRGVPHTLAGMVTLAMLDLYDDAELERKRVAALFGAFVKKSATAVDAEVHPFSAGEGNEESHEGDDVIIDFNLEPGAVITLPDGYDVQFAEPADVGGAYEMFQLRMLLRAAAGFGVPYADMTGDLRQTSYGSIRAGLVAFRRRVEAIQHQVMAFQFCRPVWARWFNEAVRVRAIDGVSATAFTAAPDLFTTVKWIPPKWEWIDPLKDRQAEKLAVDSGFKPRSDVVEAEGYDPEENDLRIKADQERANQLGLKFIMLNTEIVVSPTDEDDFGTPDPQAPAVTGAERVAALYGFG